MNEKLIFVVEDDLITLKLISQMLLKRGFKTSVAKSGSRALKTLSEVKPDLVLLDVNLPDYDGYKICSEFRSMDSANSDIPVVMMSAAESNDIESELEKCGATSFIQKPFVDSSWLDHIMSLV